MDDGTEGLRLRPEHVVPVVLRGAEVFDAGVQGHHGTWHPVTVTVIDIRPNGLMGDPVTAVSPVRAVYRIFLWPKLRPRRARRA